MHIEEQVKKMLLKKEGKKKQNKNEKNEIFCCLLYNIIQPRVSFYFS